jgi:hypothetical protein
MNKLFLLLFLFTSLNAFAQRDYELFEDMMKKETRMPNSKLTTITEYQLKDSTEWVKSCDMQFRRRIAGGIHTI